MTQPYITQKSGDELVTDLFHLAEAINAAMTYQAVLEAVAPILPDCQGVYLNLWEHYDYERATYIEIAAAASLREDLGPRIGHRFMMTDFPFSYKTRNQKLIVVEDVQADSRLDETSRQNYLTIGTQAYVRVPFQHEGHTLGALFFKYGLPRQFTEHEQQLAIGIADLVLAAVVRIQAQQEIAQANDQTSLLYQLAGEINAATTYQDIIESVAKLQPEANGILLNFFEHMDYKHASYIDTMAVGNVSDDVRVLLKDRIPKTPVIEKLRHEDVWFSENIFEDPRFDEESLAVYRDSPTQAVLIVPLQTGKRLWGLLVFNYTETRSFSEHERRLTLAIGDLVIAAVERIRLLHETATAVEAQKVALIAEQDAREELSLLYKVSEAIQAANTFQQIVEALMHLTHPIEKVILFLWEHMDYHKASYFDLTAGIHHLNGQIHNVGDRLLINQYPIALQTANLSQIAIENINDHPLIDRITRENWELHDVRALLLVNLKRGDRWYGVLSFESSTPRQFSESEKRLTLAISDLALGAVIRIHTQQELATAVEAQHNAFLAEQSARKEMSRLYQVSKSINQSTDMDQVLHAIKLLFPDPIDVAIFAWEHYDRSRATYLECLASTDPKLPTNAHLPHMLVEGLMTIEPNEVQVANDVNSPEWADHHATESARFFGLHSIANTTLIRGDRVQGLFSIASYKPYFFSPHEIRLMVAIADLTAVALERFRFRQAEQDALQEREELFHASQAINAANSFQEILKAVRHIDFDDGDHYLFIFENFNYHKASYIETVATTGDRFMYQGMRIPISDLPFLKTHPRSGLGIYENIPEHPELDEVTKATMLSHGTLSNLRFGLVWHGNLLGSFGVDHSIPKQYTDREKRVMIALGELISAAVERIRLQQAMNTARERAERLAEQAQQLAALEERTHLARELHDSVSQALYGIGLGAQTAQRYLDSDVELTRESVDYILTLAQAGLAEMRALIFELRPESLETEGIVIALAKQGASLQARHQINVKLELGEEPSLPLSEKESLYRVLREALHNVIKHASASQVILRMHKIGNELSCEVIDNGVGFLADQDFPGHLGLKSIRERIAQLGGIISIESVPNKGTHLLMRIPLP